MTRIIAINGASVTVHGDIEDQELAIYLEEYQASREEKMIRAVVSVTDKNIDIEGYTANNVPFERIRRITGYLTGTTNRWNNAKQAELGDRVKHGIGRSGKL